MSTMEKIIAFWGLCLVSAGTLAIFFGTGELDTIKGLLFLILGMQGVLHVLR